MNYDKLLSEAFRACDETLVATPKSYPPPADERAETFRYLPKVPEFFGQRCCHPANQPLPADSQHMATEAFHALERTLVERPASGVRATPSVGSSYTPAASPSEPGGAFVVGEAARASCEVER